MPENWTAVQHFLACGVGSFLWRLKLINARGTLHNRPRHSEIATPRFSNRRSLFFLNDNRFLGKKPKFTSLSKSSLADA